MTNVRTKNITLQSRCHSLNANATVQSKESTKAKVENKSSFDQSQHATGMATGITFRLNL